MKTTRKKPKPRRKRQIASDGANLQMYSAVFVNNKGRESWLRPRKLIPLLATSKVAAEKLARGLKRPFKKHEFSYVTRTDYEDR